MPTIDSGWLNQDERFPPPGPEPPQKQPKQPVSWANALIRTSEDAELVVQGESLEQEVSTRRLSRSDRSPRPDDGSHRLVRVPTGNANVNGFLAGRNIGEAQDSKTVHNGSMYSSSVTTGDFENYVARDVVSYIDAHYRTIASRESRGLVGHSMGGYGASRIGMKHPDVFGSLYIMSPCCLSPRGSGGSRGAPRGNNAANEEALAAVKTAADSAKLPFGQRAQLASAAAWSPNPKNPPLYLDLPIGDNEQAVLAKWTANAPLAFIDQYVPGLRRYRAIAIDVGDQDGLRADAGKLHDVLDQYDIANTFEIYAGTHTSDVAVRFQEHVMPFFSRTLSFAPVKR
jgi:S-formylglutathione hydrolase FrmB